MFLNEGHGLKDKVCHKIIFKVIIMTINGKILKILVLVEIIIGNSPSRVGNNLRRFGSNPNKVGSNLSMVGSKPKIGISCHHLSNKLYCLFL